MGWYRRRDALHRFSVIGGSSFCPAAIRTMTSDVSGLAVFGGQQVGTGQEFAAGLGRFPPLERDDIVACGHSVARVVRRYGEGSVGLHDRRGVGTSGRGVALGWSARNAPLIGWP